MLTWWTLKFIAFWENALIMALSPEWMHYRRNGLARNLRKQENTRSGNRKSATPWWKKWCSMSSQRQKSPCAPRKSSLFFTVRPARNILVLPFHGIAVNFGLTKSWPTRKRETEATTPLKKKSEKNKKKGLTKSPFSAILNVSKERGINQWNVLIAMESAEHTLNALNAERGNKNGNGILNYWRNF